MAKIEKNGQYMEGKWVARHSIGPNIERTTYKTLDEAIKTKEIVIEHFEKEFGFSREMEEPDSNYAYGVLALGWKARANRQMVESIKKTMAKFKNLKLVKVKGHAGDKGNERADFLATTAIKNSKQK